MFLANKGDEVVVSSPINVGVDTLFQKLSTEVSKFSFNLRPFIVRLYSASQIQAQYAFCLKLLENLPALIDRTTDENVSSFSPGGFSTHFWPVI